MDASMFICCYERASQVTVMSDVYLPPKRVICKVIVIDSTKESVCVARAKAHTLKPQFNGPRCGNVGRLKPIF